MSSCTLYRCCALLLDKALQHKASIKSLVMTNNQPSVDKRHLMAMLCRVLEYRAVLDELIDQSGILVAERKHQLTRPLAMVLIYEFLFGKGMRNGSSSGPYRSIMMRHKTRLKAELARLKVRRGVQSNRQLLPATVVDGNRLADRIPRYLRVNHLINCSDSTTKSNQEAAVQSVIKQLSSQFTVLQQPPASLPPSPSPPEVGDSVERGRRQLQRQFLWRDQHLPDLLVAWPPSIDLHQHPLYTGGQLILQDKASCMPAHVLQPPPGSAVIDACAAPGNKTSHLVSLMNNTGKIYAFDLDSRRLDTLRRLTARAGCRIIQAECQSFLELDPTDYSDVEYILLDPSCSGSGIVNRMDHLTGGGDGADGSAVEAERLQALAEFQISAIKHAMRFPSVRRLVYSTCSVHMEENEKVVAAILSSTDSSSDIRQLWKLARALPGWPRRGLRCEGLSEEETDCLIRCDPASDQTNGFFVACFERNIIIQ